MVRVGIVGIVYQFTHEFDAFGVETLADRGYVALIDGDGNEFLGRLHEGIIDETARKIKVIMAKRGSLQGAMTTKYGRGGSGKTVNLDEFVKSRHSRLTGIVVLCNVLKKMIPDKPE
jgi:hypothetical protein